MLLIPKTLFLTFQNRILEERNILKSYLVVSTIRHVIEWFENRGVEIVSEEDGRMFPKSNTSQTIYDLFVSESEKLGVMVNLKSSVTSIKQEGEKISFQVNGHKLLFDKVIVCTGGSSKLRRFRLVKILGHKIEKPVPSLFTFNILNKKITQLMGLSVPSALVSIEGTKLKNTGPLLITHWGFSGPAVLKLSSIGARILVCKNYNFKISVSWCGENNFEKVKKEIQSIINTNHE